MKKGKYVLLTLILLFGFSRAAPGEIDESANLIKNGGFELGLSSWYTFFKKDVRIDKREYFRGKASLAIIRRKLKAWSSVEQVIANIKGGKEYKVMAYVKANNARRPHLKVSWIDQEGKTIEHKYIFFPGNLEKWTVVKRIYYAPPEAVKAIVRCMGGASIDGKNPGITWFDEIKFYEIQEDEEKNEKKEKKESALLNNQYKFVWTRGPFQLGINQSGEMELLYKDIEVLKEEPLSLVNFPPADRIIFKDNPSDTSVKEIKEDNQIVVISLETSSNLISYKKEVKLTPNVFSLALEYSIDDEAQKKGATQCFYSLKIPASIILGAYYRVSSEEGEREGIIRLTGRGWETSLFRDVSWIEFYTPRMALLITTSTENTKWHFMDSTGRGREKAKSKYFVLGIKDKVYPKKVKLKFSMKVNDFSKAEFERYLERYREREKSRLFSQLKQLRDSRALRINSIIPNRKIVKQYAKFELTMDISAKYNNPYDPNDIEIAGYFKTPSGESLKIPAFFYQDFVESSTGKPVPVGKPVWKIRFTPKEIGKYHYVIIVRDLSKKTIRSKTQTFEVVPSSDRKKGFIRISKINPYYFQFENGGLYFPIGSNLYALWSEGTFSGYSIPNNHLDRYKKYLIKLSNNGANFAHLRLEEISFPLERPPDSYLGYFGIGYYNQRISWEIDQILQLAEKERIYLLVTLENANFTLNPNMLRETRGSVYLKENGGPCEKIEEFWTSESARQYFRNKLRYIVSRWGYSPNIMGWNLLLEMWTNTQTDEKINWIKKMASYLKKIDYYKRPITTNFVGENPEIKKTIYGLDVIDFNTTEVYSSIDLVDGFFRKAQELLTYNKPFFAIEYGAFLYNHNDPEGTILHNGSWASAFSNYAGASAYYWIDIAIDPWNLYSIYRPLSSFVKDIPFDNLTPIKPSEIEIWVTGKNGKSYRDLVIHPSIQWQAFKKKKREYVISTSTWESERYINGRVAPNGALILKVNYPRKGEFIIFIKGKGKVKIYLDDNEVIQQEILEKNTYRFTIPAGEHVIKVTNVSDNWMIVGPLVLTNYLLQEDLPPLRVLGVKNKESAYIWIQNHYFSWFDNEHLNISPVTVKDAKIKIKNLTPGIYEVVWWNTWKGKVIYKEKVSNKGNGLILNIPPITKDIACKIVKLNQDFKI